ncbi:MAG: glyoxalase [Rhodospirillales bacterium]|jgi:PhnB protein|nr:glyoxalase [Rhodospirillales bacterium]
MAGKVRAIPEGYRSVTPYLVVKGAAKAIDFYKKVFGAREKLRMEGPGGTVAHAELEIGDSVVMLADENPQHGALSPATVGGTPVSIMLYVEDVDRVAETLTKAGARTLRSVQDMFYGDRSGSFEDPFGHRWHVSTHIEDVTPEEIERRMAKMRQG